MNIIRGHHETHQGHNANHKEYAKHQQKNKKKKKKEEEEKQ